MEIIRNSFSPLDKMVLISDDYALFAAVVEEGSLSAAGRALKLSPAMVSKRLAALETRLGARLIQRTTRRSVLTDVGQAFYERVVSILSAIRQAELMVAGRTGTPSGRLRVSVPTSFGRMHIAPWLKGFLDAYPGIVLDIDLTDHFVDLVAERVDVAVRIGRPPDSALAAHRLAPNRRLLCASPGYIAAHGTPRATGDLRDHALLAATGQLPWRLTGPEGPVVIDGESRVRTNSSELVRELVLAGAGIAFRSTWDIAEQLRAGSLVRILSDYEGTSDVGIYAVRPRADLTPPNVRAFIEFLETLYAPTPPWDRGEGRGERENVLAAP
jgi:DNA-binding transcriptional LysR family regulator